MAIKMWRKPLDHDKIKVEHGRVVIIEDRCKGCGFCVEFCPEGVLSEAERLNPHGYHPPEVVKPDACVNCGLCSLICPDFAIFVIPIEERSENEAEKPS